MRLRGELAGELAAVDARLAAALGDDGDDLLAAMIQAAPGIEHALSAALGERLRASVVGSRDAGIERIGRGEDAARALVGGEEETPGVDMAPGEPPTDGARPLLSMVEAEGAAAPIAARLLADAWLVEDLAELPKDFAGIAVTADGECFDGSIGELRRIPRGATDPALVARSQREELTLRLEQRMKTEQRARRELEIAEQKLEELRTVQDVAEASPEAVRRAQIEAELTAERRHAEAAERAVEARRRDREQLAARVEAETSLLPGLGQLEDSLATLGETLRERVEALQEASGGDEGGDEGIAAELRECSKEEFGIQSELREAGEGLTVSEVEAAQLRSRRGEAATELAEIAKRLERELAPASEQLTEEEREEIETKLERVARRHEQIGPVNPLAKSEYEEAREHVTDLKDQRVDLESALRELQELIRRTDREITAAFEETFEATSRNFEEMVGELFPGGRGKLRKVEEGPREVPKKPAEDGAAEGDAAEDGEVPEVDVETEEIDSAGIEIEVTPAGKSTRRLTLLSGGEKSLVALAFVFAVLLARPAPFYILDEVEAALDDINLDRFIRIVRRFSDRSQFVIVTHQKRSMDAADVLYGVSMSEDGISKVVSRRLPRDAGEELAEVEQTGEARVRPGAEAA